MLTLRNWLLGDWLNTRARMRARLKFIRDIKFHYARCHSLKAAFFLAKVTL